MQKMNATTNEKRVDALFLFQFNIHDKNQISILSVPATGGFIIYSPSRPTLTLLSETRRAATPLHCKHGSHHQAPPLCRISRQHHHYSQSPDGFTVPIQFRLEWCCVSFLWGTIVAIRACINMYAQMKKKCTDVSWQEPLDQYLRCDYYFNLISFLLFSRLFWKQTILRWVWYAFQIDHRLWLFLYFSIARPPQCMVCSY